MRCSPSVFCTAFVSLPAFLACPPALPPTPTAFSDPALMLFLSSFGPHSPAAHLIDRGLGQVREQSVARPLTLCSYLQRDPRLKMIQTRLGRKICSNVPTVTVRSLSNRAVGPERVPCYLLSLSSLINLADLAYQSILLRTPIISDCLTVLASNNASQGSQLITDLFDAYSVLLLMPHSITQAWQENL